VGGRAADNPIEIGLSAVRPDNLSGLSGQVVRLNSVLSSPKTTSNYAIYALTVTAVSNSFNAAALRA
jgi:hypothetical protein